MESHIENYIAFGAFMLFAGTGLAIAYVGFTFLVSFVAYLSPWVPAWMWLSVLVIVVLAVAIESASVVGSISAIASKRRGLRLCSYLLFLAVAFEIAITALAIVKKETLGNLLYSYMLGSMSASENRYSTNISDTQLWDEIQMEVNCCGVKNYQDWYSTSYGQGKNVPDSCCLLIMPGCGQNVSESPNPADVIVTEGCLPVLMHALAMEYHVMGLQVWMPVLVLHLILGFVLFVTVRKISQFSAKGKLFSAKDWIPEHVFKYGKVENCA